MKKIIALIAALTSAAFVLTACGGGNNNTNPATTVEDTATQAAAGAETVTAAQAEAGRFTFTYKGNVIAVKSDFAPIHSAIGEPKSYTEETSCAFDGLDKNYVYSSFMITTYPDGDLDRVNSITLLDDTVETADGICVGDAQSKVEEVYGAESFNGVNAYILTEGDAQLTVIIESEKVKSIQYAALFE